MGGRLAGLDALRGIAALMVVAMHLETLSASPTAIFQHGYLAVDFFFMLSGYVMARTYEHRMADIGPAGFLWLRLKRLWPILAIGSSIGIAYYAARHPIAPTLLLGTTALLLVPLLRPGLAAFFVNPPAWSILFELFGNGLHALVFRAKRRHLIIAAVASAIPLAALPPDLNVGSDRAFFLLGVPRVILAYSLGIVLWRTLRDRPIAPAFIAPILLPAMILAGALLPSSALIDVLFVAFVCPLLIGSGLAGTRGGALGSISFPLYAVHYPLSYLIINEGGHWTVALAASLGLAWFISFASATRTPLRTSPRLS